ncbi:MAG: DUF2752 domain-containing protein [Actinomycetota bacterium]|nr:DUF2752 domain-containing protein [Actinomycetota bacterium]MDQ3575684.1 DUF2752 domain-containing protein [Actinomycetota bacterium]
MEVQVLDTRPLRWMGGAMLATGALLPALPGSPGLPCPLRTLTGIPCPFCGMTTSVKETMRLRLWDALAANPGGVLLVVAVVALLITRPSRLSLPPTWVIVAGVAFLWVWELQRFSIL